MSEPNCWPSHREKFIVALTASAAFRTMVGLTALSTDEAVQRFIFGDRVTHSRDGHKWTREELKDLRHYAAVFSHPAAPYGKHRDSTNNYSYRPHGTQIVSLQRLLVDAVLMKEPDGNYHTTDEHDRAWEQIVGDILSQLIDALRDVVSTGDFDVTNVATTKASKQSTQGSWQSADIIIPWREPS